MGRWTEQQPIDETEHHGVRADAECERAYRREGEQGTSRETSDCAPRVGGEVGNELADLVQSRGAFVDPSQLFPCFADVAEFSTRLRARLADRHPLRNQLGGAFIEVCLDFVVNRSADSSARSRKLDVVGAHQTPSAGLAERTNAIAAT